MAKIVTDINFLLFRYNLQTGKIGKKEEKVFVKNNTICVMKRKLNFLVFLCRFFFFLFLKIFSFAFSLIIDIKKINF